MIYPLTIKDIVGNALIEIVENTGKRYVLFSQLNDYISAITNQLKNSDIEVIPYFNRNETNQFFYDYSSLFDIKEFNSDISVMLKSNVSSDILRKHFRVNLSLEVLKAFVSEETVQALLNKIN